MEDLLIELEHAAKTPAKQRSVKVSVVIDKLNSSAYDNGISTTALSKLVDIITLPNELDQASLKSLIRSLYPLEKVSSTTVINVVSSLGHGTARPHWGVQEELVKWLIKVYDVVESQRVFSQLYAILFNLLDTLALRAPLCHILSLITRRKHVRPFRIQILMELTRQTNLPALVGLMRVYKDYYPDVIVGDAVSGRASVFTHPDPEWRQRLREIQELNFARTQDRLSTQQQGFRVSRKSRSVRRTTRSSIIPEVHTFNASDTSVTLEEIEDVNDFVEKLEKIEPPNQMVAVIGDALLQRFIQLRSSEEYSERIDLWLYAFFEDQLQDPGSSETRILDMLQAILIYTQQTKNLPVAALVYLQSMMATWNGTVGRDTILRLLTFVPSNDFQELHQTIFQLAEDAILEDADVESYLAVLTFYKELLDRWTTHALSHSPATAVTTTAISDLIGHATNISLNVSQVSQTVHTFSVILAFYESVTATLSQPSLTFKVRIIKPPAELVYNIHFTSSLSTLSRLCSVLAHYKRAFEGALTTKRDGQAQELYQYPNAYVNNFNGFLMDLCNCLWRARALNTTDPNALGCLVSPVVTTALTTYVSNLDSALTLPSLFSFSTSPTLCFLAIQYVRDLEDSTENIEKRHAGPVGQASLKQLEKDGGLKLAWQDYKLGVLQYLETKGAPGVGELMYNTMKNLMAGRTNKTLSGA